MIAVVILLCSITCLSLIASGKLSHTSHLQGEVLAHSENVKSFIHRVPNGVRNGIASGLAATVVKITLAPFDTVKTVQQMNKARISTLSAAISVVNDRGFAALWAGTPVTIIGSAPSVALYYGVFNSCKVRIARFLPSSCRPLAIASAATIGNTFASFLRVPYEVFKQRLQLGKHKTLWEAVSYSYKYDGGFLGLFSGGKLAAQIARDVPYAVITAVSYELLQAVVNMAVQLIDGNCMDNSDHSSSAKGTVSKNAKQRVYQDAMCGAAAGGFSTFVTTPLDVVKTRLMSGLNQEQYNSVASAIKYLWKKEGPEAFFRGTSSRLLHKIPANGLFFICYEFFRDVLGVGEYYKLKT